MVHKEWEWDVAWMFIRMFTVVLNGSRCYFYGGGISVEEHSKGWWKGWGDESVDRDCGVVVTKSSTITQTRWSGLGAISGGLGGLNRYYCLVATMVELMVERLGVTILTYIERSKERLVKRMGGRTGGMNGVVRLRWITLIRVNSVEDAY